MKFFRGISLHYLGLCLGHLHLCTRCTMGIEYVLYYKLKYLFFLEQIFFYQFAKGKAITDCLPDGRPHLMVPRWSMTCIMLVGTHILTLTHVLHLPSHKKLGKCMKRWKSDSSCVLLPWFYPNTFCTRLLTYMAYSVVYESMRLWVCGGFIDIMVRVHHS